MKLVKNKVFEVEKLKGEEYHDVQFVGCRFVGSLWKFAGFKECKLMRCAFEVGVLEYLSFEDCSFPETKLSNLDFSQTLFRGCNFERVVMRTAVMANSGKNGGANKEKFSLLGSSFVDADLEGTNFVMADLTGVSFERAKMAGVIFERCNLREANLVGADVAGVVYDKCNIGKTKLDTEGFITFGLAKGFVLG